MRTQKEVEQILEQVKDPEIPVLTVSDLGIIRAVKVEGEAVEVTITPTYSGCPATQVIEDDIRQTLEANGIAGPTIKTVISPPWTSDWISEAGRRKLEAYGIAPPAESTQDASFLSGKGPKTISCPRCKSANTRLISQFGSTPCKAQYQCKDCLEPFDYFKCI